MTPSPNPNMQQRDMRPTAPMNPYRRFNQRGPGTNQNGQVHHPMGGQPTSQQAALSSQLAGPQNPGSQAPLAQNRYGGNVAAPADFSFAHQAPPQQSYAPADFSFASQSQQAPKQYAPADFSFAQGQAGGWNGPGNNAMGSSGETQMGAFSPTAGGTMGPSTSSMGGFSPTGSMGPLNSAMNSQQAERSMESGMSAPGMPEAARENTSAPQPPGMPYSRQEIPARAQQQRRQSPQMS